MSRVFERLLPRPASGDEYVDGSIVGERLEVSARNLLAQMRVERIRRRRERQSGPARIRVFLVLLSHAQRYRVVDRRDSIDRFAVAALQVGLGDLLDQNCSDRIRPLLLEQLRGRRQIGERCVRGRRNDPKRRDGLVQPKRTIELPPQRVGLRTFRLCGAEHVFIQEALSRDGTVKREHRGLGIADRRQRCVEKHGPDHRQKALDRDVADRRVLEQRDE